MASVGDDRWGSNHSDAEWSPLRCLTPYRRRWCPPPIPTVQRVYSVGTQWWVGGAHGRIFYDHSRADYHPPSPVTQYPTSYSDPRDRHGVYTQQIGPSYTRTSFHGCGRYGRYVARSVGPGAGRPTSPPRYVRGVSDGNSCSARHDVHPTTVPGTPCSGAHSRRAWPAGHSGPCPPRVVVDSRESSTGAGATIAGAPRDPGYRESWRDTSTPRAAECSRTTCRGTA